MCTPAFHSRRCTSDPFKENANGNAVSLICIGFVVIDSTKEMQLLTETRIWQEQS